MDNIEEIIKVNEMLIYKIASKFHDIDKDDLYQAGVIGVIKALNNYKENNNAKFSTYAYNYIFGEMYELANNYRNIKLNKDILRTYKKIESAKYTLCQKLGREITNRELAQFLNIDEMTINQINMLTLDVMSLDNTVDDSREVYDTVAMQDKDVDMTLDINSSLDNLSKEEQDIIKMRYFKDLTQSQVAQVLNWSQVKVSRYEKKSLVKMYNYLAS